MRTSITTNTVDRIVRPAEAVTITGRSLASIWRDEKAGNFPVKIRIGDNATGYRLSDLLAWIETKATGTIPLAPVAPGSKRGRKPSKGVNND
jgi:predicted DNA-binding transcriptional regulator AlpA